MSADSTIEWTDGSEVMPCWNCGAPVDGEWFDGQDFDCQECGTHGVATFLDDNFEGCWAFIQCDEDGDDQDEVIPDEVSR